MSFVVVREKFQNCISVKQRKNFLNCQRAKLLSKEQKKVVKSHPFAAPLKLYKVKSLLSISSFYCVFTCLP